MSRHAYCIIAHTDLYCLNRLIESIDDARNDIFLLIDKKSNLDYSQVIQPTYSQLFSPPLLIQKNISIYWGDISLVKAELLLFKMAIEKGPYDYYHLLSGQDLPIKSQDYIHDFLERVPTGTNFIGYVEGPHHQRIIDDRISFYVPFTKYYRHHNLRFRNLLDRLRYYAVKFQKMTKLKPNRAHIQYRKGCEWTSLSHDFTSYLIDNQRQILNTYRGVPCADELYKQSAAWNSSFKTTIYNTEDEYIGCMREIDWNRGGPYTFRMEDLTMLKDSSKLFARKFDSTVDKEIIDMISSKTKIK